MSIVYVVIDTESEGFVGKERENACAWCVGALLKAGTWFATAGDLIPDAAACARHYEKGTFSVYWNGLDKMDKNHKRTFTKLATVVLGRQLAADGRPIELVRQAGVWRMWRGGGGRGVAAFDAANPAHVSEVLRVFFTAEVVSCGIVVCVCDPLARTVEVAEEHYAVYRPSAEHKASAAARAVHGLDEATLQKGRDVSELHARLMLLLEKYPRAVFAAHFAQHDWAVLIEGIDNRLVNMVQGGQYDEEAARLMQLRRELRNPSRWTCTWQRCVLHGSRLAANRLTNYQLPTVYEAVTSTSLAGHHNALTDAYACAVILCRLLGCSDADVRRAYIKDTHPQTDDRQ